jgi:hypothetical protein
MPLLNRLRRVAPTVLAAAFGMTCVAGASFATQMGSSEEPNPDDRYLRAPTGSEQLATSAAVPGQEAARGAAQRRVGVIAYTGQTGQVCLAAGPMLNGRVGQFGEKVGFKAYDPDRAPGMCGNFTENLKDFGGIALSRGSASQDDPATTQSVAFGLVDNLATKIEVRWPDGSSQSATADPAPGSITGAAGVWSAAAPAGVEATGAHVTLTRPDGSSHDFEL